MSERVLVVSSVCDGQSSISQVRYGDMVGVHAGQGGWSGDVS